MTFFNYKKRQGHIKRSILRDVYEQNLKMVGQEYVYQKRQRVITTITMIGSLALLMMTAYLVFNHSSLHKNPLSAIKQYRASESTPLLQNEDSAQLKSRLTRSTPSQYQSFLSNAQTPISQIFGLKVKTIIIDPGHGGKDPGAVGKLGTLEKDITLDIGMKLKKKLEQYNEYQILMTREKDIHLSLEERILFANTHQADIYIHVNYIPSRPTNIIETYYFGPNSDKHTLSLVEQENRGTQYTLSDFKDIIQKIGNTIKTQESNLLALCIQKSLYRNISMQHRASEDWGVRKAPFIVLLGVDIPSVLSEVTCLSNHLEEKKLNLEPYREEIAQFLEEGIVIYLNQKNNKSKPREVQHGNGSDIGQK
jgi:N-acetylmuramoyl-L-alanine amidase